MSKTVIGVNKEKINRVISALKKINPAGYEKLYNYKLLGGGKGEIVLYFIINDSCLRGGSQYNYDLLVNQKKYEIKDARISAGRIASEFRASEAIVVDDLITELYKLKDDVGTNNTEGVGIEMIKKISRERPQLFRIVEEEYQKRAYVYFKEHKIIFLNIANKNIEAIENVERNEIMIDRVTLGKLKPKIKL